MCLPAPIPSWDQVANIIHEKKGMSAVAPTEFFSCPVGQPGPAHPWGGRLRSTLEAQRPGGPACPAGVPISPEKWGERGPGPSVIGRRFRWNRRRLAPATWVPARSRAGIQAFSRESPDAKSRGGWPPAPPFFYGPLAAARWFWGMWRIVSVEWLFRCPCTCPDLDSHFAGVGFG